MAIFNVANKYAIQTRILDYFKIKNDAWFWIISLYYIIYIIIWYYNNNLIILIIKINYIII